MSSEKVTDMETIPEIQMILDAAPALEALPENATIADLENATDPSQMVIKAMKKHHYSNDEITNLLSKHGYGWYPPTGAIWKGRDPTPEEQIIIDKIRGPEYSPFASLSQSTSNENDLDAGGASESVSDSNAYAGISENMNPGSMLVMFNRNLSARSDNTCWEKPTPTTEDWAEVGVTNSANDQYAEYFTYDNNEGEWMFHGAAKPGWFFPVKIYVTSTQDAQGYVYNSYIDNKIVRTGHLKSRLTGMNNANEIWALKGNPFYPLRGSQKLSSKLKRLDSGQSSDLR